MRAERFTEHLPVPLIGDARKQYEPFQLPGCWCCDIDLDGGMGLEPIQYEDRCGDRCPVAFADHFILGFQTIIPHQHRSFGRIPWKSFWLPAPAYARSLSAVLRERWLVWTDLHWLCSAHVACCHLHCGSNRDGYRIFRFQITR